MTAAQIAGWMAYAELEPFGPLRDDQRAATAACAVVNSIPFRGEGARVLRPADLFASLARPSKQQTVDEMAAVAVRHTLASGGTVTQMPKPTETELRKLRTRSRLKRK